MFEILAVIVAVIVVALAIVLTLLFDGLTTVFLGAFLVLVAPRLIRSFRSSRA